MVRERTAERFYSCRIGREDAFAKFARSLFLKIVYAQKARPSACQPEGRSAVAYDT